MSLEHFPRNEISFSDLFNGRLERFGVTTDNEKGALIAPDGTTIIVRPTAMGHAQFPKAMPVLIRNAIATEFRIDFSECGEPTHVVVEGPSRGDAEFICRWLNAAIESDRLLQQHYEQEPEFRKSICLLEREYCIDFAVAGTAFIRKWLKDRQPFVLNLRDPMWAEIFTVMVGIGFFTRTQDHYQMTVPRSVELDSITESLLQLAETDDAQHCLHPERHIVAMTAYEAESLAKCPR